MQASSTIRGAALSAILIAPDRGLADLFSRSTCNLDAFQILLELKSYPPEQTLDIRLRQLQPEVVLIDVATNLDSAVSIISCLRRAHPELTLVALDRQSGADTILRVLRAGASEFLYAPFEPVTTADAIARLFRLRKPERVAPAELGSICAFSSVKPGSGSSTLATQTAFALKRTTSKRVLLADFDLTGGAIGFYLKLNHASSALDALECADDLNPSAWTSMVASSNGLDILSAPAVPYACAIETGRLQSVLDYARTMYDWVILDLPVIFQRTSLVTIPQADRTFLVSTPELPSLHLARRSITMLEQLGFPRGRFEILVNRAGKRDGISKTDIEKLFNCPVHASFPNDYFALHRVVTLGRPLKGDGDLGKAIETLAGQLAGAAGGGKKTPELSASRK
jgi:pilus assembly protein CpaE